MSTRSLAPLRRTLRSSRRPGGTLPGWILRSQRVPGALIVLALAVGCSDGPGDTAEARSADQHCLELTPAGTFVDPLLPVADDAPEIATGYRSLVAAHARSFMAVTANPVATRTACDVLARGGSAVDAAIAAQMVLNLVEPQSSGIGGGAFLLHFDPATGAIDVYDGRETAPAAATPDYLRWISEDDRTTPQPSARASGRSIGTPGTLHVLDHAHREHGMIPWAELFEPAIRIAEEGFRISPRMAASIAGSSGQLARDPIAAAYFLTPDGSGKPAGTLLQSPEFGETFRRVAAEGIAAFYTGSIAQDIVDAVSDTTGGRTPGLMTLDDLAAYRSVKREAVCTPYRAWVVCGMPPPSSGGITVASALGILETFDLSPHAPPNPEEDGGRPGVGGIHLVTEAQRLAYADRDRYIADTDFVALPGGSWDRMLDPSYLAGRAALIDPERSMGTAEPGDLGPVPLGSDATVPAGGTTHLSIVDREGRVVVMTSTIEGGFGSYHMTRSGFLLNNELTDFSSEPFDAEGRPIANRVEGGKRPRSSMAPTLVFERGADGLPGDWVMATGSPGGGAIIQYVLRTLVGVLDWGLDPQQAVSMISFGASNSPTTSIGGEHPLVDPADGGANDPTVAGLRSLGHSVSVNSQSSGLGTIVRGAVEGEPVLVGGADPRREGIVLGDLFLP